MPSPHLDDYQLGSPIGAGTVGTIYLATETATQQRVAIKKLHPGVSRDELIRARFERETTILQRLRHPNIVACYGGGEDEDGNLYYIMELVEAGTVKDLLESVGNLAWPIVVDIGRQVCSALQYAHNHGIIHRDLKPGNLFLTRNAEVKLGDFGIARDTQAADLTSTGLTVGTHAYMSPEQITGDVRISGQADLYALGCCLMEMLTGRKPFVGDNFAHLFEQHLRTSPPRVRDLMGHCPPELDEVVNQLLQKRPEDRPFNARAVQGVMISIAEAHNLGSGQTDSSASHDVGASSVTDRGREMLQQQIRGRLGEHPRGDVSWTQLAVILAVLVTLIGFAVAVQ